MKTLKRSSNNKMLGGVCAGIADYLDADPTIVRIIVALCTLIYGVGVLAYIACWFIMPLDE